MGPCQRGEGVAPSPPKRWSQGPAETGSEGSPLGVRVRENTTTLLPHGSRLGGLGQQLLSAQPTIFHLPGLQSEARPPAAGVSVPLPLEELRGHPRSLREAETPTRPALPGPVLPGPAWPCPAWSSALRLSEALPLPFSCVLLPPGGGPGNCSTQGGVGRGQVLAFPCP